MDDDTPQASEETAGRVIPGHDGKGWVCSICGGFVRPDATRCKHSGVEFLHDSPHSQARIETERSPLTRTQEVAIAILIVLVILCIVLGYFYYWLISHK